mmetsp:Transcript_39924/g.103330  ORF Transcript_39924/g.103330 Transcript_39924/m.103330 type:complete len:210 (+) Transcript_39924:1488-2117(+)
MVLRELLAAAQALLPVPRLLLGGGREHRHRGGQCLEASVQATTPLLKVTLKACPPLTYPSIHGVYTADLGLHLVRQASPGAADLGEAPVQLRLRALCRGEPLCQRLQRPLQPELRRALQRSDLIPYLALEGLHLSSHGRQQGSIMGCPLRGPGVHEPAGRHSATRRGQCGCKPPIAPRAARLPEPCTAVVLLNARGHRVHVAAGADRVA